MVDIVILLAFPLAFGLLAVWHGGNLPPKTPKFIKNSIWSLAQVLAIPYIIGAPQVWYVLLLAYLGNFLKTLGHGLYFSLGTVIKYIKPERIDPFIKLFFGTDPRTIQSRLFTIDYSILVEEYGKNKLYWRCVFGMAISGLLAALGTLLVLLGSGAYLDALIIALGASIGKSGGYMIGYKFDKQIGLEANITGDMLTGVGLGAALGWVFVF